jgi:hypothetical protein
MEITESNLLTRNLTAMQRKLAAKLKKQGHYLSLHIPVLQNRSDLVDLKLEKLRNNRDILENTLKTLEKFENPEIFAIEIEKLEDNNEENMRKAILMEKEVNLLKKKQRDIKRLEKKEIILNEKSRLFSEELLKFNNFRKELSENSSEIHSGQLKIVEIFHLSKKRLENLMISKEELRLSIPLLHLSKENSDFKETQKIKSQNLHLRQVLSSLQQDLQVLSQKNSQGRRDLEKWLQNFKSREVLLKVQARYLEEKKARIDFIKSELASIEKALSQVKTTTTSSKPSRIQSFPRVSNKSSNSQKSPCFKCS